MPPCTRRETCHGPPSKRCALRDAELAVVVQSTLDLAAERSKDESPEAIAAAEAELALSKDPDNAELAMEYRRLEYILKVKTSADNAREHGSAEEVAAWDSWLASLKDPTNRDLARKANDLDREWRYTADFRRALQGGGSAVVVEGRSLSSIRFP